MQYTHAKDRRDQALPSVANSIATYGIIILSVCYNDKSSYIITIS